MATLVWDIETFRNYLLVAFKDVETRQPIVFQMTPKHPLDIAGLRRVLENNLIVGFNSKGYDLPVVQLALTGADNYTLYEASSKIIAGMRPYEFAELYGLSKPEYDHIDIMDVAPLKASLKIYAGRLHAPKMADLPVDPDAEVTPELAQAVRIYNINDLDLTIILWNELEPQIKLREQMSKEYGVDLRSKSDAQMAEAVIASELEKELLYRPKRPEGVKKSVRYTIPDNVQFISKRLNLLLDEIKDAKFTVKENGSVVLPDCLDTVIRIGAGAYRCGIGGLHSSEKSCFYIADDSTLLIDRDVASYYPSIILNQQLYPAHLGPAFLKVYGSIVARRLAAKAAENNVVADSLKIVINGSFGKFGSMWSLLYSPHLLIQVTISGQLYLLMLIEMIEAAGIEVISANTDGIVLRCPKSRYDDLNGVIAAWEGITGFVTEETRYKALYSRDVNNYLALYEKPKKGVLAKTKGAYANPWEKEGRNIFKLHKNPTTTICVEAVTKYLAEGVPYTKTIRECKDIRKFLAVRAVSGGAKDSAGDYLGKAVRFYYAKQQKGHLSYSKRKAKVNKSDGAKPLMELPEALPSDINYGWYELECQSILNDLGYLQRNLFQDIA